MRLLVDPGRQEPLERLAGLVDHTEGCIARARERRCGLDGALQQRVERQLGAQCDACVYEHAKAVVRVGACGHTDILLRAARRRGFWDARYGPGRVRSARCMPSWVDQNDSDPGVTVLVLLAWLALGLFLAVVASRARDRWRRLG